MKSKNKRLSAKRIVSLRKQANKSKVIAKGLLRPGSRPRQNIQTEKIHAVVDVINTVLRQNQNIFSKEKVTIRRDAVTFLQINFKVMIYEPLRKKIPQLDLLKMVAEDVETIIKEAANLAQHKQDREITGHQVLLATGIVWKNLRTMSKDSW